MRPEQKTTVETTPEGEILIKWESGDGKVYTSQPADRVSVSADGFVTLSWRLPPEVQTWGDSVPWLKTHSQQWRAEMRKAEQEAGEIR